MAVRGRGDSRATELAKQVKQGSIGKVEEEMGGRDIFTYHSFFGRPRGLIVTSRPSICSI